ncbi:hypothetical protein KBD59_00650 [Candidatus Gracilibacteria bacterium]|nr:hypothetical protein [Candidatus Gracilibacteria bacterium]
MPIEYDTPIEYDEPVAPQQPIFEDQKERMRVFLRERKEYLSGHPIERIIDKTVGRMVRALLDMFNRKPTRIRNAVRKLIIATVIEPAIADTLLKAQGQKEEVPPIETNLQSRYTDQAN